MLKYLKKIFGTKNEREIKRITLIIAKVNEYEKVIKKLTDDELKLKTPEFKSRLEKGETLDDILPEAFAVVRETSVRTIGQRHYDTQLIGGIVLHEGKIAEMRTGEGKTLVASLPAYLNALSGKGVHLVTVNDYLAERDSFGKGNFKGMGNIYSFLGLTYGCIKNDSSNEDRRAAYGADITYGTNNEFGFDYLRDNMATRIDDVVQKYLHYAIVDEVDSILIDEARTPLIISAPAEDSTDKYMTYARLVKNLKENEDYNIDEKQKTAVLTEEGIAKMEKFLGVENIYTEKGFQEVNHIEQALKAISVYEKDVDYVINNNEIIIVDEFTGRLMPGRRFSSGLHQAIEAKEGVAIKRESKTLASISFQNYFRLFKRLAGMTGTALTEAEEFTKIYGLEVIVIPTNKPVKRDDSHDAIYKNEKAKFNAVCKEVKEINEKGQPVLIGTISIEKSEKLSNLLKQAGISHTVLNAKYHEKEAEIIAKAGEKNAVTIATNMAGRGTDIKLGDGVKDLGGLYIIGTERHESRRIDNQLRGRAGRQGDPGISQFYVSMDDQVMRIFGGDRIKKVMDTLNLPDDMPIENGVISRSIESAQKKVEGYHFDVRHHLVEYDDVMNQHREIIYRQRRKILESEDIKTDIVNLFEKEAEAIVLAQAIGNKSQDWNYQEIIETVNALSISEEKLNIEEITKIEDRDQLINLIKENLLQGYLEKEKAIPDFQAEHGSKVLRGIEKMVYLRTIDGLWMDHITQMTELRSSVAFSGYGQRDPLVEYKTESYYLFQKLRQNMESRTIQTLLKANIVDRTEQEKAMMARKMAIAMTNQNQIEESLSSEETSKTSSPQKIITIKADEPASVSQAKLKKVGRNDPCPCGSGKKFKKCCGR